MQVRKQNSSNAVCDDQGTVKCIQQATNQSKNLLSGFLLVGCKAVRQFPSWGKRRKDTTLELSPPQRGPRSRRFMLAKGEKGVNGKCVLVCTKLEKEWSIFAQLTAGRTRIPSLGFCNCLIISNLK